MTPPRSIKATDLDLATAAQLEGFVLDRLWSVLDVAPDSPEAEALEAALLAPARSMLERSGKRFRGRLVERAWRVVGGEAAPDPCLPSLVELIHAGSLVVDDIEDGSTSRRGAPTVHQLFGVPIAINAGNFMYFWATQVLDSVDLPADLALALHRRISTTFVRAHAGQALDLSVDLEALHPELVPDHVEAMTLLKTGSFMGLAAAVGASAARGSQNVVDALETFGIELGMGLQMLDDLGDLLGTRSSRKRFEDLRNGRVNWPWAWAAETVSAIEWRQLGARLAAVRGGRAPIEPLANDLLERVGFLGRHRAHVRLQSAFASLRAAVGDGPVIDEFQGEIARLETSYV